MLSVHGKNIMHLIFLGNLSLKCFPQRHKANNQIKEAEKRCIYAELRAYGKLTGQDCFSDLQSNDLIYNFSILNFHLINSSCSAAVDRMRNSSGKLTLPLLRQEDPQLLRA